MPTSQDISLQDLSILLEKRNEETHTCTLSAGRAQGTGILQAPYPWQSLGGKNMPRVPGEMGIYSKWTYWASTVYQKTLTVDWLWQTCRDCFSHFGEFWSRRGANQPRVHLPPRAGRGLQQRQSTSQESGARKPAAPLGLPNPRPGWASRSRAAAHRQPRQEKAGPRPPRGRAYPSGEYSRLKTAPWVRVLRYTESAGWMEP